MEVTNKEAIAVFENMKRGIFPFDARPYCDAAIHALRIMDRDTIVQEFADKCRECGNNYGRRIKELERGMEEKNV